MATRIDIDEFDTLDEYLAWLPEDNAECMAQMLADAVQLACFPSAYDAKLFAYLVGRSVEENAIGTLWGVFSQARNRTSNRRNDAAEVIERIRQRIHSVDLKTLANYLDQYRSRERDLIIADAILDLLDKRGRLTGVSISYRTIMRMCNLSLRTVHKALTPGGDGETIGSLIGWFVVIDDAPEEGRATTYSLSPNMVNTPPQGADDSAGDSLHGKHTKGRYEGVYHVGGLNAATLTHATFRNYRADDSFTMSTMPITAAQAVERGLSERYMLTAVYRRRLNAGVPSLGRVALVVIDALVDAGMVATIDELRTGGRSHHTVAKAVARLSEVALVEVCDGDVTLRDDWEDHLLAIRGLMPTAGALARRIADDAKRALAEIEAREKDNRSNGTKLPDWLEKRKESALKALKQYDPSWYQHNVSHRLPSRISGYAHIGPNVEMAHEAIERLSRRQGILKPWELDQLHALELAQGAGVLGEIV